MVTSVAAAFFASGGRNAGTPSDMASTPVIAVQPLANAVQQQERRQRFGPRGIGRWNRHRRDGAGRIAVEADRDQGEHAHDKEIRGDGEDLARFLDPSQVAHRQKREERQAHFHAVRVQLGQRRRDCRAPRPKCSPTR